MNKDLTVGAPGKVLVEFTLPLLAAACVIVTLDTIIIKLIIKIITFFM